MSTNNNQNLAIENQEELLEILSDEYWEGITGSEWKVAFAEWWLLTNYGVSDLSLTVEQVNNLQEVTSDESSYVAAVDNILNSITTTLNIGIEENNETVYSNFKEVLSILSNYSLREDFLEDLENSLNTTTATSELELNEEVTVENFSPTTANNTEDNSDVLEPSENNQTQNENTDSNPEAVNEEFVATTQELTRVEISSEDVFTPQFNSGHDAVGLDDFESTFGGNVDGSGYAMVIIDTGIDLDHEVFGDRIVYSYDFYGDNDSNAQDGDGHGSHVSSIAANIATGADIIHLKVFDDSGSSASFYDIQEALQWVTNNIDTYNIASVNLSLGLGNYDTQVATFLSDEFQTLADNDVIVAAAAGNDFYYYESQQGVNVIGADANVITVGAVYEENEGSKSYVKYEYDDYGNITGQVITTDYTTDEDRITSFSQRHETLLDIFAPGALIDGANATGGYMALAGTSQASPFIAGIATLAQDLAVQELGRRLTVEEFRDLMQVTGVTINDGDDENDNVTNTGLDFQRVDAYNLGMAITAAGITEILPGFGDNFQAGTNSSDTLDGGNTADYIFGGNSADTIKGYEGNDTLVGGNGKDTIKGGSGNDIIYGNGGKDTITGGNGNDTLIGGAGQDSLKGGGGADYFVLDNFGSYDFINKFQSSQGDKIAIDVETLGISDASLDNFNYGSTKINLGFTKITVGALSYKGDAVALLYNSSGFDIDSDVVFV